MRNKIIFINYSNSTGLQLSAFRNCGVSCSDDVIDFCKEIQRERECNFAIYYSADYYADALRDGVILDGLTQDTVEMVYNFLNSVSE